MTKRTIAQIKASCFDKIMTLQAVGEQIPDYDLSCRECECMSEKYKKNIEISEYIEFYEKTLRLRVDEFYLRIKERNAKKVMKVRRSGVNPAAVNL